MYALTTGDRVEVEGDVEAEQDRQVDLGPRQLLH